MLLLVLHGEQGRAGRSTKVRATQTPIKQARRHVPSRPHFGFAVAMRLKSGAKSTHSARAAVKVRHPSVSHWKLSRARSSSVDVGPLLPALYSSGYPSAAAQPSSTGCTAVQPASMLSARSNRVGSPIRQS
jgi:hypothetical protein